MNITTARLYACIPFAAAVCAILVGIAFLCYSFGLPSYAASALMVLLALIAARGILKPVEKLAQRIKTHAEKV